MKKLHLPLKAIGIVVLVVMMGIRSEGATINITSSINWSAITGGSGAGGQPTSADIINVYSDKTLTVDVSNAVCGSLQLGRLNSSSNSYGMLTFSGTDPALTVTSTGGLSGYVSLGGFRDTDNDGTITFTSTATLTAVRVILGSTSTNKPAQGIINMTAGGTLICESMVSNTSNDVFTEGTGTVKFTGTFSLGLTDVGNELGSFYNLHINSGIVTYAKNITILSDLLISTGATLDLSTFTSNRSASGGTLTVAGTLQLGGTSGGATGSNFPSSFSTHTMTSGTVNYDNTTGSQTIFATPAYNNLTLGNSSGTQTAGGNITVNGTLTTTSGGTFNMATYTLSVATVSHSAILRTQNTSATPLSSGKTWGGTVQYDASAAQSVSIGSYNNLTISGASGAATAGDITVTGILNLSAANPSATQGTLHTGANSINMGVSSTTTGQGDVTGIVKRTHTFANGVSYSFGSQYTSITFLGVSGGTKPTSISCKIVIGSAPSWRSVALRRVYTFAKEGTATDEVITNLHYLDTELNTASQTPYEPDENQLVLWDAHGGTPWTDNHPHGKSNNDAANNWIGLSGFSINYLAPSSTLDFKQFGLSYSNTVKNTWLGADNDNPTSWNVLANWSYGTVPLNTENVLIPAGKPFYPSLTVAATALSIEIEAGASLTAGSQTITIAGNVGAWVNNGTFDAGTGTVTFSKGDLTKIVSIAGTTNFNNLTFNANTYVQPASNSIIRIGGLITNNGVFDCESTTNTIEYNKAGAQTVIVPNGANSGYHNLILSGTSAKTLPTLAVGNDFTLSGTVTVTQATNTVTIGGNFSNSSSSTVTFAGTAHFNGTLPQIIGGGYTTSFANLKINNSSGVSLSHIETVTLTLKIGDAVPNSSLNDNGYQITGPGSVIGTSLSIGSGSTFILGSATSATTLPIFKSYLISTTGIVNYASDQSQVISTSPNSNNPYGDVLLSGAGTKTTASGTLNVGQNLICNSPVLFNTNNTIININQDLSGIGDITQGDGIINLKGNWTNTGTFTPSSSEVILNNSESQFIAGAQDLTFTNITVYSTTTNLTPGNLNILESLTGTGAWIQGVNTQLNISGFVGIGVFDAVTNVPNTVAYNGSLDQSIYGTNYYSLLLENSGIKSFQSTTTSIITDLSINGTASAQGQVNFTLGGNLNIGSTASFYVSPTSTATISGDIINDGSTAGLVIQSSIDGTGSLVSTTPDISATVERYIEIDQKWHFLSPPVASQEIWPQFAPDPGVDMSWGAYNAALPYNWDFYYYNPNALVASQLYWVNLRKDATGAYNDGADMTANSNAGYGSATQLSPPKFRTGRGYLVAYTTDWTIGSPTTHTFAGVLNSGNVDVPIYYNSENTYNLVGNPFPCSIDWMEDLGWTRTCLGPGPDANDFWIYNDTYQNYGAFSNSTKAGTNNVSQYIAPGQAFFVRAATAGTLTMTDALKIHSPQTWLKNTEAQNTLIRLDLTCSANTYKDEMIVKFDPSFTGGGTQKFNSFYAESPELYSVKDGNNYSIDRYNTLTDDMKVDIAAKTGVAATYTITATNIADFTLRDKVYLLDKKTGVKTNLKQTPSYSFAGTPDDDRNRFQLIFGTSIGVDEETNSDITIYASENIIYVRNDKANEPYTVMVSNMLGQIITRTKLAGNTLNQIELNRVPGVYVVTVYSEGSLFSKKVVVK